VLKQSNLMPHDHNCHHHYLMAQNNTGRIVSFKLSILRIFALMSPKDRKGKLKGMQKYL